MKKQAKGPKFRVGQVVAIRNGYMNEGVYGKVETVSPGKDALEYCLSPGGRLAVEFALRPLSARESRNEPSSRLLQADLAFIFLRDRLEEIAQIIERVDQRCTAADGPVAQTKDEITAAEIKRIYELAAKNRHRTALGLSGVAGPSRGRKTR